MFDEVLQYFRNVATIQAWNMVLKQTISIVCIGVLAANTTVEVPATENSTTLSRIAHTTCWVP